MMLNKNMQTFENASKAMAEKLVGRLPIIYSSETFYCVAYRWKCEFNENSKIPAFCNKFPELDHNEIIGYHNLARLNIPMHVMMLHDEQDNKRIQKRMSITKKLLREMSADKIIFTDVAIKGDDMLSRMFTTILLGDLTSYHLALQYKTDPTPVDIIEKLKKEMGPML
jgi:glucose/mannose-6-phosphate isomerase